MISDCSVCLCQQAKRSSTWRPPLPSSSEWGVGEGEEWWEGVDVWNQVFRLRFSGGRTDTARAATLNPGIYRIRYLLYVYGGGKGRACSV